MKEGTTVVRRKAVELTEEAKKQYSFDLKTKGLSLSMVCHGK